MGFIVNQLVDRYSGEQRSSLAHPAQWFIDWAKGGTESASGVTVNHQSALKHSPFWAAVRVISGTLASLPFLVYERLEPGGKRRLPKHPAYRLLHDRLNDYIDVVTFIETLQSHVLTYGNGFAEIQRDGTGRPIALWPLLPNRTQRKLSDGGVPYYEVRSPDNQTFNLPDYNVLHVKGLGFDGYTGYDVVTYHKETIGYGVAVKEYGARFFGHGANVGGVIEHPTKLSEVAHKHLKESLKLEHEGLSKAHRTMILEEGMKFNRTGIEPEKAQALEVQKWTVDDCSRIFQIPPHKLGSMEFSKYNNVEQLQIDFVTQTMFYWLRKWELECNYKLFSAAERGRLFSEFLIDGLLRGDIKSRYEAFNIARNGGWMCVDDIREKENMNPLPDGKGQIFLQPLNMEPAGTPREPQDDADRAIRTWLASQWTRIIGKQLKALSNGANGDFFDRHREYARKLLIEPVSTLASARRIGQREAAGILDTIINESITSDVTLEPALAGLLADRLIEQIGETHAL